MEDENKGMFWIGIMGLIFSFTIGIPGVMRSFENNTSAWTEMWLIIYTGLSWLFGALALFIICCVAAFLIRAVFEKLDALFVMYNKSEAWCKKLDSGYEVSEKKYSRLDAQIDMLDRSLSELKDELNKQQALIKQLQTIPSVQAEVNQQSAEDEFTGSTH